jgi:DNA mismatch endonuclease (patch repair protein)
MDRMTTIQRSYTMSRIRSKNTLAESMIFKVLRRRKISFFKHYGKLPGKPDVVILKRKLAVFIDGDFWHGWRFKAWERKLPRIYWRSKIKNNITRDGRNRRGLKAKGWKVLRIWEHQLEQSFEKTLEKLLEFLNQ